MNRTLMHSSLCLSASVLAAAAPPPSNPVASLPVVKPVSPALTTSTPALIARPAMAGTVSHHSWKRHLVSPAVHHVAKATAAATIEPDARRFLNAVQVYPYADGAVYRLYTAPGQVSDIALQPGEVLGAVASGDTVRWVIGDTSSGTGADKRSHILVKPFTAGLSTNLVITTDRRSYHLALTSTASTAMAALSWTYPQDALIALRKAAEQQVAATPVASGLALDNLHFDYTLSGDRPAWRPLRAFDDGRQTFIEFPASLAVGEAPPLFIVQGKEAQLVNYRVQGRYYVVDRLFETAELRLGAKHQEIVRITRTTDAATPSRRAS